MHKFALAIFMSLVVTVAGAAAQNCPKVTFLREEGTNLVSDGGVYTHFTGNKKVQLDTFTYTFTASAGKVVHENPTDYYMKIDTKGVAAGTRINVQVTAKRGSCKSNASTWYIAGDTPTAVSPTPAPVSPACPTVKIEAPATTAGGVETLVASIQGGDKAVKPTFKWATTAGEIRDSWTDGTVYFLDVGVAVGTEASVSVEVAGFGCPLSAVTKIVRVKSAPCPTVKISSPDRIKSGEPLKMTVSVSDPKAHPTFTWRVSAGTISSGQYTSSITIDATGVTTPITATVDLRGLSLPCDTSASATTMIESKAESRKFDEALKKTPAKKP